MTTRDSYVLAIVPPGAQQLGRFLHISTGPGATVLKFVGKKEATRFCSKAEARTWMEHPQVKAAFLTECNVGDTLSILFIKKANPVFTKYDTYFARANYGNDTWMWVTRNARLVAAAWALCEDGKRRVIRLNQSPDTFFSHPGRASFFGKTLTGFCTSDADDGSLKFCLYNESIKKLNRIKPDQPWIYTRLSKIEQDEYNQRMNAVIQNQCNAAHSASSPV